MRHYLEICRLVGEVFAVAQVDISRMLAMRPPHVDLHVVRLILSCICTREHKMEASVCCNRQIPRNLLAADIFAFRRRIQFLRG